LEYPLAPVEVTEANFVHEVLENPGYVLVFFWAPWCAHCRGMITIMKELARERAGTVKVAMINTEKESLLARRFAVMSVPRLTLYRHGRIIDEVNGALSHQQVNEWLTFALGKSAD
jgi:thioredoxin 1